MPLCGQRRLCCSLAGTSALPPPFLHPHSLAPRISLILLYTLKLDFQFTVLFQSAASQTPWEPGQGKRMCTRAPMTSSFHPSKLLVACLQPCLPHQPGALSPNGLPG